MQWFKYNFNSYRRNNLFMGAINWLIVQHLCQPYSESYSDYNLYSNRYQQRPWLQQYGYGAGKC